MIILWILFFSLLGSVCIVFSAAFFLLLGEKIQKVIIPSLVSFATGTLLAAALLELLPNALLNNAILPIMSTVLVGIVIFFLLEKVVIWHHCHDLDCKVHSNAGSMILIGDFFHNATDGLIIAASFLFSFPIGLATSISILTHEIPQEIGDFAMLLHGGYPKRKALMYNLFSSLSTLPTAILAYFALETMHDVIPYVMAFSAASFLYIALADLYPLLHQKREFGSALQQFIMILAGIGTILFFH